jgi:hypothetical protein
MKNTVKGMLMQIPVLIMLLVIVVGSFVVWIAKTPVSNGKPITLFTPITILIFVILYFWGRMIENSSSKNAF